MIYDAYIAAKHVVIYGVLKTKSVPKATFIFVRRNSVVRKVHDEKNRKNPEKSWDSHSFDHITIFQHKKVTNPTSNILNMFNFFPVARQVRLCLSS